LGASLGLLSRWAEYITVGNLYIYEPLATWGEVVGGDTALMMAIIDRLLHHGEVFYLRGASYRMRGKEAVVFAPVMATSGSSSPPTPGVVPAGAGGTNVGEHFGGKEVEE
jgi:hypothetical protein